MCYDTSSPWNRKRSRNISEIILEGVFVMKELWDLFVTFARIGGFTFGGGYAMLPMLQKEVVEARHWTTEEELVDYFAIGQCTPGIIAVNTATFIGYKLRGVIGGIVATLGVIARPWSSLPSSPPLSRASRISPL